jgi:hypothetical protein
MRKLWNALVVIGALASCLGSADAKVTLTVVPSSDLKILDPIWTPAYITRNHGYLIYDTLFAMDEKGEIRPQMVETYTSSADKLTHVFRLRDGLLWHDGTPVTAEDCIASINRSPSSAMSGCPATRLFTSSSTSTSRAPNRPPADVLPDSDLPRARTGHAAFPVLGRMAIRTAPCRILHLEGLPSVCRLRPCRFSGTWRRPPDF